MTNNKRFFRTLGKLALTLTAAHLLTCEAKLPDHYCGNGELPYDPLIQFCFEGKTKMRCGGYGGDMYAPPGEECVENTVVKACGNGVFVALDAPCAGYAVTINVVPAGGGIVYLNGVESIGAVAVSPGTHRVEAKANAGYTFSGWSGAAAGVVNPELFEVDGDKALTATFRRVSEGGATSHVLAAYADPPSGGTVSVFANDVELTGETTTHNHGTPVTVHARPATGYTFTGWAGASDSKATPITITMDDSRTLVATFEAVTHTLTVSAVPQEGGTVTLTPTGQSNFAAGTQVIVTAEPIEGYSFKGWTVAGATISSANSMVTTVTMGNSNATVTAAFAPIPVTAATYTLIVNRVPSNGGTTSPALSQSGIAAESPFNISASAASGHKFVNWTLVSGEAVLANENDRITMVTLNSNATITANFQPIYMLTVSRNDVNYGTVTPSSNQSGITPEQAVNISATAASGYAFVNWTVTNGTATFADANSATTTVTLGSNATVRANFQRVYTLTVDAVPRYGGTVSPTSGPVAAGTAISISATPASGYTFRYWDVSGWSGGRPAIADPSSAVTTVTLSGNATVTALFDEIPTYTLTVGRNNTSYGTVTQSSPSGVAGAPISITATPASGYTFQYWSVPIWSGGSPAIANTNSAVTTVTLTGNATITANFRRLMETSSFEYGGQTYKTVKIGSQWWMAENLNFATDSSWCYDCNTYGRLYAWNAAKEACEGIGGWHLPTQSEWNTLVNYAGGSSVAGKKLKSTSGWNSGGTTATDEYEFSALPGGNRDSGGSVNGVGGHGYWWSATEYGSGSAYDRDMYYGNDDVYEYNRDRSYGFSVRCVKDD